MVGPQEPRRLRRLGALVLDRLRLVEDHVVEGDVLQERRVAPQRAVGGEDHVAVVECPRLPRAVEAGVIAHPQPRGEAGRLLLPVEDERAGNDDERGLAVASLAARLEERQHLHGLAEAHVVGQAPAEAEVAEEGHPAEAERLVVPQAAGEAARGFEGTDPLEAPERLPRLLERGVRLDLGLGGEERVEEAHLAAAEAEDVALGLAEARERRVAAQPLLGEHAERAVVEDDARLAAAEGLEEPRQGHALPLEVHLRLEVEPVDPGRDTQAHRPRPAVDAPLGLDVPALARERHHDRAEAARRQAPRPVRPAPGRPGA